MTCVMLLCDMIVCMVYNARGMAWCVIAALAEPCVSLQDVHVDTLLPDVIHFPAGTDLHDHPLVQKSCLILQVLL